MTIRRRLAAGFILAVASGAGFVLTSGAMATDITPAVRSELAPSGKLRVGLNHGNFLLVTQGSSATDPKGVASDIARELGRRIGVPVEFIKFDTAGKLGDGVKTGAWDVAFLGNEPQRAAEIAFTAAYLEIPATYLVPAGSPIRSIAEVDREGVRIAVADKSAYELWLSRNIKHAKLMKTQGIDGSFDLFVKEVVREMTTKAGQKCTAIRRTLVPESMLGDVMGAHDRGSVLDREQVARDRAADALVGRSGRHRIDETLARGADQEWQAEGSQFAEPRNRDDALRRRLAEADAGVEDDLVACDAGAVGDVERAAEECGYVGHDVDCGVCGLAIVHDDDWNAMFGDDAREIAIALQAPDVVDHGGALGERRSRNGRLHGVDRNRHLERGHGRQHRFEPPQFFLA